MGHKFIYGLAGAFMLSSAAAGGELPQFDETSPRILLQEDDAVIFDDFEAPGRTSFYLVMCPGYGLMRDQYDPRTNTAVTLLFNATHEDYAQMIATHEKAQALGLPDGHYGQGNSGLILSDGTIEPAYTNEEFTGKIRQYLTEAPDKLAGTNARNPDLLQRMKKHSLDFCFSNF